MTPVRLPRLLIVPALWISAGSLGGIFPAEHWRQYQKPEDAGWSSAKLQQVANLMPRYNSAALMVVYKGAVVGAWGEYERRFINASSRKSLLSAVYGLYVDKGVINLDKNLAQLGIDEVPPLTSTEKTATIRQLLEARSGIYLPAAYEPPSNPKPKRGAYKPGEFWCYNNWDFNALLTIFENETHKKFFEVFDAELAKPLGMQDWRVTDGYYHYEWDKSIHPAYPFRLSARDMARFGLLFLNKGLWDGKRVLSEAWVQESTSRRSIDVLKGLRDDVPSSYGYLWWISEAPLLKKYGTYYALGAGEHSIDVIPGLDLVVVNRSNSYGDGDPKSFSHLQLVEDIIKARTGEAVPNARLVPLKDRPQQRPIKMPEEVGRKYAKFYPNAGVLVSYANGELTLHNPYRGHFTLFPDTDGSFIVEDSREHVYFEKDARGNPVEYVSEEQMNLLGIMLVDQRRFDEGIKALLTNEKFFPKSWNVYDSLGYAYTAKGDREKAIHYYRKSIELNPDNVGGKKELEKLLKSG